MKILKHLLLLVIATLWIQEAAAQHERCGVGVEDQQAMLKFVDHYYEHLQSSSRSNDPVYVPVKFHLVAKSDGTGRIRAAQVLEQFDVMIEDFKQAGMYLYLDDASFNYIDNTSVYENASNFPNTIVGLKDPNAANIFVTENADTPGGQGTTLGYYSPGGDYVIIRINDVSNATASLSHELGHFFSLPHTFFGWEAGWNPDQVGNPVTVINAPGTNIPVELVDRSNCTVAADRICDTPPDYNFGFGAQTCEWTEEIFDRNGDLIEPMEDNFMSYFLRCNQYFFTPDQIGVMRANFNAGNRAYLRRSYVPDTTEIEGTFSIMEPMNNEKLDYYDQILIDWEDATNANNYLVALNNTSQNRVTEVVVDDSELIIDLEPNTLYFAQVIPFNDGYTGASGQSIIFTTGNLSTDTEETSFANDIVVFPNPIQTGNQMVLSMDLTQPINGQMTITDMTGKLVHQSLVRANGGNFKTNIDARSLEAGMYILKIQTDKGNINKRIFIQ